MRTKKIPQEVKSRLSYNPSTGEFVWVAENKMHPRLTGKPAGTIRDGYVVIKIGGSAFRGHRIAWYMMTGEQPKIIDHINGITTDNRFENLRNVGFSENAKNHGKEKGPSGLPVGVRILPSGRYQARITCDKKVHYLGTFNSILEAKKALSVAKTNLFGEFARAA
ncbi:hypothetical protein DBR45_34675 [Pseudomonas sp. HMWF031]|nr:hypothetical protein DBR45_34675 [Pseudomonas sp. HMWF031]